ncbi:regulator [Burkholderia gladioli]|uniref:regulator n=1 Tax=Burkholderia gladioli TaxID=28095 RepID=UPI00163EAA62|nr:regulator [Burkholderia gladioli]
MNLIETAVAHAGGLTQFTKALNERIARPLTYQAVKKWIERGRLPRTEWTGETHYADAIENLTGGRVLRADLLRIDVSSGSATDEAR